MPYSISTIVPVYNEEKNIKRTTRLLDTYLTSHFKTYEIIIVESGSTDNTPLITDQLAKINKHVHVVHQKTKKGFGNGLREGYTHAKYDLVWYMSGDYPYDVHVLDRAIPLISPVDYVVGYRTNRESISRSLLSKAYNLLIKLVFGLSIKDVNFSFKLIKKKALQQLNLQSDGWFIDVEILIELKKKGFSCKQIPVTLLPRISGKTKVKIVQTIKELLKEIYTYKRRT